MRPFRYAAPRTVEQAVTLLQVEGSEALAGGTDLLALLKDDVEQVDRLVGLAGIDALAGVDVADGTLRIGATTTLQELLDHEGAVRALPALETVILGVASAQLRAMGTVGGDLLQRPRCWYYRRGYGLLPVTADGRSMVEAGDHRYHAVFPYGEARFVSASSLAPLFVALGAEVLVAGPQGEREMPVQALYRAPVSDSERENTLAAGELVVAVTARVDRQRAAVYEVRQRRSLDWPLAAAAVAVEGRAPVERARVVLGHAAPVPHVAAAAGESLAGRELSAEAIDDAAAAAVSGAAPLHGNRYKVALLSTAVRRALRKLSAMEV